MGFADLKYYPIMGEERNNTKVYEANTFIGSGGEFISANVDIERYFHKGDLEWVNAYSQLVLCNGNDVVRFSLDMYGKDDRESTITKVDKILNVLTDFRAAILFVNDEVTTAEEQIKNKPKVKDVEPESIGSSDDIER